MRLTDEANYEVIRLPKDKNANRSIAVNKKAFHDYFVEETYEAGIELTGTEVKSLREGKANIKEAWCAIENGELFIKGMHISPYDHGNIFNVNPLRVRKLLLHKKEISHLYSTVKLAGYSIVPLSIYFKGSLVKLQIGLCKGKKLYDKRDDAANRDAKRAIDRALKQKNQ